MHFPKPGKWALLASLAVLAALALLVLPVSPRLLIPADEAWSVHGCFQPNAVHPGTKIDPYLKTGQLRGLAFWGSWCGSDANTGELQSPPFEAPLILQALVAGHTLVPGVGLFLEDQATHERILLPVSAETDPGEQWLRFEWQIPSSLRHKTVRLIAVDQSTASEGWIGVSTPTALGFRALLAEQIQAAFLLLGGYLFDLTLFLLPGFVLVTCTPVRKFIATSVQSLVAIVATGATLGYLAFWAFFFNKPAGRWFTSLVFVASILTLVLTLRASTPLIQTTARRLATPIACLVLAGAFYLCLLFLFTNPAGSGAGLADTRFFHEIRPGDNLIPLIFADRLYSHQPLHTFISGDWLSSDRPPLQSGIVLLERPLHIIGSTGLDYEILSAGLQSLWICGVWCLLSALGVTPERIRLALGLLMFSGFLFYNSVYTWPKLLAACFILMLLSLLFESIRTKQPLSTAAGILAAACLGLALMSHPGSVFSLGAFVVLLIRFHRLFRRRFLVAAACVVIAFAAPWSAYQKFVDPPGNRLIKMHLAGVQAIDSRSAWQAIHDAYESHPFQEIVSNKLSNLRLLAGLDPFDTYGLSTAGRPAAAEKSRISQREYIWNAVGLLNIGWLCWLILTIRRMRLKPIPYAPWLILAALANFVFWSLITFGPDETVTTHSSYADILLLSVGLIGFILAFPRMLQRAVLALQVFNLCAIWVWSYPSLSTPISSGIVQWPLLIVSAVLGGALLWFTQRPEPAAE